jgi:hypothetical protein
MIKKTINLYSFDELSKDQQAKALENCRHINADMGLWEQGVIDEWKEKLERQGFISPKIYYSGFWSQGDGACFSAEIDLPKFLKGRRVATKYAKQIENYHKGVLTASITTSGHYRHEYSMNLDYCDEDNAPSEELEALILEHAREQARAIYKALRASYDYDTSNEAIIDTIEANKLTFNYKGEIEHE